MKLLFQAQGVLNLETRAFWSSTIYICASYSTLKHWLLLTILLLSVLVRFHFFLRQPL